MQHIPHIWYFVNEYVDIKLSAHDVFLEKHSLGTKYWEANILEVSTSNTTMFSYGGHLVWRDAILTIMDCIRTFQIKLSLKQPSEFRVVDFQIFFKG